MRRLFAHLDGGEQRRRGCVATEARQELLRAPWVRVARRRRGAVTVRESASRQRVRRAACAGRVRSVEAEAEVLDLVEPAEATAACTPPLSPEAFELW